MVEISEAPSYRVAREIRAEMARQRVTQTELADKIGMPLTSLRRRLSGETELTVNDLFAIADALDRPVHVLLPHTVAVR